MLYEKILRPLLFSCPPELAHDIAKHSLRFSGPWRMLGAKHNAAGRLKTRLGQLAVNSPIGLSAGFDKNAQALNGLAQLGFGYITVGSLLPEPREGNPKPRLLRLKQEQSLLNCYGLPSDGLQSSLPRLQAWHRHSADKTPVIANIDCPSVESYVATIKKVQPYVSAIEIGTQCPNNRDDNGEFNSRHSLESLLKLLADELDKPLFVKLLPFNNEEERQERLELAEIATHYKVDGLCLPGTWRIPTQELSLGYGQLSGRLAFQKTLETVRDLRRISKGQVAIKANGGIFNGKEVFQVLEAGASSADVLASFIYRGWQLPGKINAELLAQLDEHKLKSIADIGPHL